MIANRIFRILVADDDEGVRWSMADALGRRGHEVETAADGIEAVAIARRFLPAFGLFDLEMPRLDGLGAAGRLRAAGLETHIIIVSSAGFDEETRIATRRAGAKFLAKPIDLEALWGILEEPEGGWT